MADTKLSIPIQSTWDGEGTEKAKKEVSAVSQAASKLGQVASAAVVGAGTALAAFSAKSVQSFATFESGMAEIFSLLPGITDQAMSQMTADVQQFARENGKLTTEVVPALYQALSAGVPKDNVFAFLETANDAAVGGVTTMETAVDGLTSVVNSYGADVISVGEASDLMFRAVVDGKTTFEELSKSLYNVIPTAASLGLGFENVTAALAAMTAAGTPTSVATTQIRQLLVELSKEGTKAAEVFEQMAGTSFRQFIADGGDLNQALELMQTHAQQSGVGLNDLFSSVEAGNAALALSGTNAARFAEELERMGAASGSTAAAADTMSQTLQYTFNNARAAVEQLQLVLGEKLAPAIVPALEGITVAVDKLITALNSDKAQAFFDDFATGTEWAFGEFARRSGEMINQRLQDAKSLEDYAELLQSIGSVSGELALVDIFGTVKRDALAEVRQEVSLTSDSFEEYLEKLKLLSEQSGVDVTLGTVDLFTEWNQYRVEQEAATQAMADSRLETTLAKTATEDYAFALDAYQQTLLGITDAEQARAAFQAQSGQLTAEQIAEQEALIEQFERRERTESGMYSSSETAVRAANLALQRQIELEEQAAQAAEELARQQREAASASGDYFVSALNNTTAVGFFNESLEQLENQYVVVGGRTAEQNEQLDHLQDAYNKAARTIEDYQAGIKGANLTDEERNAKIQEQLTIMENAEVAMQPILSITGELAEANNTLTINQDAVNNAIFQAADASGASAVQLAILGGALGIYSEEAMNAALQSALIQEKINQLAAAYVNGEISVSQMRTELQNFIADVSTMAQETINATTGTGAAVEGMQGSIGEARNEMDMLATSASNAKSALEEIPSEIDVHIGVTSDPLPDWATGGSPTRPEDKTAPGEETPMAAGGVVTGGIPGLDSVPALLMPGERVLSVAQNRKFETLMAGAFSPAVGTGLFGTQMVQEGDEYHQYYVQNDSQAHLVSELVREKKRNRKAFHGVNG